MYFVITNNMHFITNFPERKCGCSHGFHEAGLYATIGFHWERELGYRLTYML
jgi:hypothetical protein